MSPDRLSGVANPHSDSLNGSHYKTLDTTNYPRSELGRHRTLVNEMTFCYTCSRYFIFEGASNLRTAQCQKCLFDLFSNTTMSPEHPIPLPTNYTHTGYPSSINIDSIMPSTSLCGATSGHNNDLSACGLRAPLSRYSSNMEIADSPLPDKMDDFMAATGFISPTNSLQKTQDLGQPSSLDNTVSDESSSVFSEYETDWEEDNSIYHSKGDEIFHVWEADGGGLKNDCGEVIDQVLSPLQQELLNRMMTEFWVIFKQENDFFCKDFASPLNAAQIYENETTVDTNETQRGTDTGQSSSTTQTKTSDQKMTTNFDLKHKIQSEKDNDDADDDRRNRKRPRRGSYLQKDLENTSKFACPYRKYNPGIYNVVSDWRTCALTPLETVARVKAHLYRHHRIFPCRRCKKLFKNQEAVDEHQNELEGCERRDIALSDGITSETVEKLKSRKKTDRYQPESDRWRRVYKLLFPLESYIPDPYFEAVQDNLSQSPDSREIEKYDEFCRQELPRSVRSVLEQEIRTQSVAIEDDLRNRLVSIVRDCQDQMFLTFKQSRDSSLASRTGGHKSSTTSITISLVPAADHTQTVHGTMPGTTDTPQLNSLPSFLQPPPPHDLASQQSQPTITISDVAKPTSDSGYASSFCDIPPSSSPNVDSGSLCPSFPTSDPINFMSIPGYLSLDDLDDIDGIDIESMLAELDQVSRE